MSTFRVPYPADPERRRSLFERAAGYLARHGTYQGTPDGGTFEGHTPVGRFAGSYRSTAGSETLEITLSRKPLLIPTSLVEHEVKKFLQRA
jgi:hypothetical protein